MNQETLSQYPTQTGLGGVAQVEEHLPSKHEARNSNPSAPKKKKKKKEAKCMCIFTY
jgi:hypothetical protein